MWITDNLNIAKKKIATQKSIKKHKGLTQFRKEFYLLHSYYPFWDRRAFRKNGWWVRNVTPSKQATVQCKSFSMVDYTVYSCAVSLIIPRSSIALAIRCQVAIDWRNHPSSDFDVIHILRPPPFSSILFRYRPLLSGSPLSRPLQRNVTSTTSNKPNFGPGSR